MRISEAFDLEEEEIEVIEPDRKEPKPVKMTHIGEGRTQNAFERRVFDYLYQNREKEGIREVYVFQNMSVDGAVKLVDGRVFLIEAKSNLNWKNACNARVEVQRFMCEERFLKRFLKEEPMVPIGALVIFEEFSTDWKRKLKNRDREKGWDRFYIEEKLLEFPEIRLRIARLGEHGIDFGKLEKSTRWMLAS